MANDARSRYEIVNELANKRIGLIGDLGQLKSREAIWKAELEKTKLRQTRNFKQLENSIEPALEQNHKQAELRKRQLEELIIEQEQQLESLKQTQAKRILMDEKQINLLLDDDNSRKNYKATIDAQIKTNAEEIEDGELEIKVRKEQNDQSIIDVGEKIKSIDMAIEALKSISANNEKSKE